MFKFIHAADIHLDSPLRGLSQYEGAPVAEIRGAARRAFEQLVKLAIDERVAFVLIAGDFYDGDWRDYNTGLYFVRQASLLREAGIPLYLIAGNHDAANRMTRSLRLPDNVTLFSTDVPQTAILRDYDVAIHGQSFERQSIEHDLSAGYPVAEAGLFHIGLLHTCATGREGHDRYAPCTVEGLRSKEYDYWALGHVHQREILNEQPFIAFSGNIQGRHIRETGPKGCLLVTVHEDRSLETQFQPLDVLRWERAQLDLSALQQVDELWDLVYSKMEFLRSEADGRFLATRIELTGATPWHRELLARKEQWTNEIRSVVIEAGQGEIWAEKIKWHTRLPSSETDLETIPDSALGELKNLFAEAQQRPEILTGWNFDLDDLLKKLPPELKEVARTSDPEWIQTILKEAESRLWSELMTKGEDR